MIPFTIARYYLSDKGLQDKTNVLILDPRELQIARNVHFYETGSWTKRSGYAKRWTDVLSGSPILTGLYEFIKRDGTKKFIASCDKLYYGSDGDTAAVEITGSLTFTPGTTGENLMSFITFNNKTLGANGVEALWQYDGTTASTLAGSPPICPIIATYQNFVFIAGNSTYPYRLYFSNDGVETTWTGTDYIDIGDLTSPIKGLATLFGKLYIFTRKGMYQLSGYDRDTFSIDEVTTSVGCVAHKSIVKVDNNLIFLTDRGIYSFDGINVHYLSGKIQTYIEGLNYARTPYIVAELYKAKNQVWFSVSTGSNGSHNNVICMTYDPTASETTGIKKEDVAFAIYTGMAFNCFGLETSATELDRLFAGSYTGYIFKQDKGNNDNGSGIDFVVKPPPIDMSVPETFKRFRYIKLFTKQTGNYNLNISYKKDFGTGDTTTTMSMQQTSDASLWGTMIWGASTWGGASVINQKLGFSASGSHLELIFSNATADQPIVIRGFSIYAQLKGLR